MKSLRAKTIQHLARNGPFTVRVAGQCMGTALPDRSRASFEPRSLYWPGDIVATSDPEGGLVSHRLLGFFPGRRGWSLVTGADCEIKPDNPVPVATLVGKAVRVDERPVRIGLRDRGRAAARFVLVMIRLARRRWFG